MSSAAAIGPTAHERLPGNSVRGLFDLGRELFDQEQYEAAGLALQRRLLLDPDDAEAGRLLGLSLLRSGDARRAGELLEPLRSSGRLEPDLCLEIGEALAQDDPKTARRWILHVIALSPDDLRARSRLGELDAVLLGEARTDGRHRVERRHWWR